MKYLSDMLTYVTDKQWEKSDMALFMKGQEKGKKYMQRLDTNLGNKKPWFHKLSNWDRGGIAMLNRIRADHYNLAASLHRKGITRSPKCECGNTPEDIDHMIWECEKYRIER